MILLAEFLNAVRILDSIDEHELVEAGMENSAAMWHSFRETPVKFLMQADLVTATKIWSIVNKRADVHIAPVSMGQTMQVLASAVGATIATFGTDTKEDELATVHLCGLAVFLHQLTADVKHPDKVRAILGALSNEIARRQAEKPADAPAVPEGA